MFSAAYRSSSGALTVFAASGVHIPEAASTVRAPDDERYAARDMLRL
jgi:hypothetical protein